MPIPTLRKWLGIELIEVSMTEKAVSTLGGGLAILALIAISTYALPVGGAAALITSMGASAVLLFGVPHGQLSQPWPVIAGHGISAFIGVACAQYIHHPALAAACAVGLAIGAMQQLKCIHPPGGATAFTAVMGSSAIHQLGFGFVLFPVLTNAVVMVLLAVLINYAFRWRRYPNAINRRTQRPHSAPPEDDSLPTHEDIIAAIRSRDSFVDISEDELMELIELLRSHPGKSA
ncbi:HPP family protein [Prosthecobacter sp.]|uniref:HPP family protein n=1 Tax=Prosthecobacter sp. TaxID=1965333 RepID=UPI002489FCBC|nr:HPP family protein [Prosthecobacter sp.]MDI1315343.1 HPP family protein [Prosthecobacter sp.]